MLSTTNLSAPRGRRPVSFSYRVNEAFGWLRATCLLFLLTVSSASWAQFNYSVYHGSWNLLPDFSTLTPALTGTTNSILCLFPFQNLVQMTQVTIKEIE